MNSAVAWFARNHVAANCLMAAIIFGGLVAALKMKIEIFPETSVDVINISVPYPGAAPEEVEEGIVTRIEEAIQDLQGIKEINSTASEGSATISAEVATGYNVRNVLDDIKVRVDAVDTLPEEAEKPVIEEIILRSQVLSIAITGDTDEATLKEIAERIREDLLAYSPEPEGLLANIQATLGGRPEITQASVGGVRPYEIAIEISESSLRRYRLTFDDVANAIRNSSLDLPGGTLRSERGEILLRTQAQAYRGHEFEKIVVLTNPDGTYVTLGDVATIIDGFEETALENIFDGTPAALVDVYRTGEENALDVARLAQRYVESHQHTLPPGISMGIWKDDSVYLQERITLLLKNAVQGLFLVFLTLALFLRLNLSFWVCLGIPLSFLGAFAVMNVIGVSLNMISLFALILVLGIVVDDAIVVGESIYTESEKHGSGVRSSIIGAKRVAVPVTFAVLTTIVAFTPMLNIPGVSGKIWGVIPLTVIPCLLFSMIESKFILPAHLSHLKTERSDRPLRGLSGVWRRIRRIFSGGLSYFIQHIYRPGLFYLTRFRYLTVLGFVCLFMITITALQTGWIKFVYFPRVPADFVICRLEMPFGTPTERTADAIHKISQAALEIRDELAAEGSMDTISHMLSTVGDQPYAGAFAFKPKQAVTHLGEVTIELAPSSVRSKGVTSERIEKRWREKVGTIPGAVDLQFTSILAAGGDPINVALSGNDFDVLRDAAQEVKDTLNSYAGVIDIRDDFREGKEEIKLDILPSAETIGISRLDLARQVRQAFYGEEAQRIQRGRDEIKVLVRYPREERSSLYDLNNLRVRTPDGREVPFDSVAKASFGRGFASIKRLDRKRTISIIADVDSTITSAQLINERLLNEVLPSIRAKYSGVNYSFEGEAKEQAETLGGLRTGAILAFFAMFALMAIPFRSYIQPIILMLVIPFSLIGAIGGHVIMGHNVSMLSVCGIIALAGVVVNDGLVLIDYINQQRRKGLPIGQAVRLSGQARFRAILLTSLTTFTGLLPLLSETSTQAQFLKPMAISLAFGVIFATALNLILVPCFYLILNDIIHGVRLLIRGRAGALAEPSTAGTSELASSDSQT
jgi:multidrug efflux pump subunit AcrB